MIGNLPAHPLIVHFTVVLLTLLPAAVLVSVVWGGLRKRLDWLLPVGAIAAALLAMGSGQWAIRLAIAFAPSVVLWWASVTEQPLSWADRPFLRGRGPRLAFTALAVVVSVACLVVVTLTGHSGATAVWGR